MIKLSNTTQTHNEDHTNNEQQTKKTWATFTYYGLIVRKITNIFKHTNIQIAFKNTNTLQQLTKQKLIKTQKKQNIQTDLQHLQVVIYWTD